MPEACAEVGTSDIDGPRVAAVPKQKVLMKNVYKNSVDMGHDSLLRRASKGIAYGRIIEPPPPLCKNEG